MQSIMYEDVVSNIRNIIFQKGMKQVLKRVQNETANDIEGI